MNLAKEAFTALKSRNEALKESIAEIDEVLVLLQRPQAACPVCDSDLSGLKREVVITKQQRKRERFVEEQKSLVSEGRIRKQAVDQAQTRMTAAQARRDTLSAARNRCTDLVRRREAMVAEGVDAETFRAQVKRLRTVLEAGDFALPKRLHKKRLESELQRLSLVKPEYEQVRATIKRLITSERRYYLLQQAESSLDQVVAERDQTEAALKARQKEFAEASRKLEQLLEQVAAHEQVRREAATAEAQRIQAQNELNQIRVREVSLLGWIAQCDRDAEEQQRKRAEFKKVDQERWLYQQLMGAFGKKGLQGMIIENAIPEIAEEANGLLLRMTDNGMQVHFETTRPAKQGGHEIETLDIRITDGAGTRPYELFSGGEAFRVNFAIRIALSRLLARRAGAKLQTLILDEGFGTQDGKGREKLVEVIDSIKDDFEKIIVITHVEELKDSFAQRIEVTKDATGSKIHLL